MRSTATEVELENLTPQTTYRLSVRYHERSGRFSVFSPWIEAETLSDVPSAPLDVSWILDAGSVWLQWGPPLRPNGKIVGYVVHVSQDESLDAEFWSQQEQAGPALRTLLRGLLPNHLYFIRVQVFID